MLKKYINLVNICLFASLCANDEVRQDLILDVECQTDPNSMEYLTKSHKCKKSKCFSCVDVRNKLKTGNLDVKNLLDANSIKTNTVSTTNLKGTNINTVTMNNAYPVLSDYMPLKMIKGSIYPPDGFGIKVKLIPQPAQVPSSPYPYTAEITYTLNGQPVPALPLLSSGKGFKVNPLTPELSFFSDLSYYGGSPINGIKISGMSGQDADYVGVTLITFVEYEKSFSSFPAVIPSEYFDEKNIFGKGSYDVSGGVSLEPAVRSVIIYAENGFYLMYLLSLKIVGTQVNGPMDTIEFNLEDILKKDFLRVNFIAIDTGGARKADIDNFQDKKFSCECICGHKKCFCNLSVKKDLRAEDVKSKELVQSKNLSASSISCHNINTQSIEFSSINNMNANTVLANEQLRVVAGVLIPEPGYTLITKFIPSNGSNAPYPYTDYGLYLKDGTPVEGFALKSIGNGFKIGLTHSYDLVEKKIIKVTPKSVPVHLYGTYPISGLTVAAVPEQDFIRIYAAELLHIEFDKPFNSIPVIHQGAVIGGPEYSLLEVLEAFSILTGAGKYGKPGTALFNYARVLPVNITREGFDLLGIAESTIFGTQDIKNLDKINENLANSLSVELSPIIGPWQFIAIGT